MGIMRRIKWAVIVVTTCLGCLVAAVWLCGIRTEVPRRTGTHLTSLPAQGSDPRQADSSHPPDTPVPSEPATLPPPERTAHIQAVAFSPDSSRLASGGWDGILRIWDPATGRPTAGVRSPGNRIWAVAYSLDGKWIVSGEGDGRVRVWDATGLHQSGELTGHEGSVRCLAFTPSGVLVSGGVDGTLRFWDLAARRQSEVVQAYNGTVSSLSAGGNRLITTGWSGHNGEVVGASDPYRVRVWDAASGRAVAEYDFHAAHAVLCPDGRYVAGRADVYTPMGAGGTFRARYGLWDAATGRLLAEYSARPDAKETFSSDGRLMATAGDQQYYELWETATGRFICNGPGGSFYACAFSPNGRWLVYGGTDGRVRLLGLPPEPDRWKREAQSADPDQLWADLIGPDARDAYRAIWTLAAVPDVAIPLLACRMRPPVDADPDQIRRLIVGLDAPDFQVRDEVTKELRRLGGTAEAALRDALARSPSPEVAMRARSLLTDLEPRFPLQGQPLRAVRAVQVLELVGTPEARTLLRQWAADQRDLFLSRQVKQSLDRAEPTSAHQVTRR